jgi:large subunit ribosomal protein L15
MVIRKSKKHQKQQGSRTHGWGAGKKHRGAGHRGGRGASNIGKRGGSRKTKYLAKGIKPYGKSGMTKKIRHQVPDKIITLSKIYEKLDTWVKQGKVKKDKDAYTVDLTALGYDKLLGTGKIQDKLNITVEKVSKKAREKLGLKAE